MKRSRILQVQGSPPATWVPLRLIPGLLGAGSRAIWGWKELQTRGTASDLRAGSAEKPPELRSGPQVCQGLSTQLVLTLERIGVFRTPATDFYSDLPSHGDTPHVEA